MASPVRAQLVVKTPGSPPRHFLLRDGRRLRVGRGSNVDLPLEDPGVSRQHLWFELRGRSVFVCDQQSRNGVTIDDRVLEPLRPTRLELGQGVYVGESSIHFRILGSLESSAELAGLPFLPRDEFELLGEAGRGGLATVWAARQKLLNRMVAIKVLRRGSDPDMHGAERFLREAQLYTQVKSPHVVELYDARVAHGQPYLILELVRGPNLLTLLEQEEALVVPQALKIAEDIANGLAAMHALGIVHRDVKPANVLVTPTGRAKLADLGLAKLAGDSELTMTGLGLGTLGYIAPEQALDARSVTFKADLYSVGATLYHAIAGQPPLRLRGERLAMRIEELHCEVPRPLTSHTSDCPVAVDRFVQRLLAKDPYERPGTAEELAHALCALRRAHFRDWAPAQDVGNTTSALHTTQLHATTTAPRAPNVLARREIPGHK